MTSILSVQGFFDILTPEQRKAEIAALYVKPAAPTERRIGERRIRDRRLAA